MQNQIISIINLYVINRKFPCFKRYSGAGLKEPKNKKEQTAYYD